MSPCFKADGQKRKMVTTTSTLTLSQLVSHFLHSRRGCSSRTLEYYQSCLDGLLFFARMSDWPEDPSQITREHIRNFTNYLTSEPHRWAGDGRRSTFRKASPGTVHHYLRVAKTLFTWAHDEEYLPDNPMGHLRLPRPQYKDVAPYTDEEVRAMLDVCEHDIKYSYRLLGVRNKAIISVFVDTGLRLRELTGMILSDLDPRLNQVRVLGKGAKFRVVPLSGEARKALKLYLTQYRQPGGNGVWQTDSGQPMSFHSVKIMLARLKKRAGVTSPGGAHRFRHYFATRCLENGMDMNSLRLLLGHSTLFMVLRYTQFVSVSRALDKHQQFSPLDRLYNGGQKNNTDERWGWKDGNRRSND